MHWACYHRCDVCDRGIVIRRIMVKGLLRVDIDVCEQLRLRK